MIKRELHLEGLHCINCSNKIENEISQLKGVNQSDINFVNKTLTLGFNDEADIQNLIEESNKIIKKIEPDIIIKEKIVSPVTKKIFILTGLCCQNCSIKLEKEINQIYGIKSAVINFSENKLILSIFNSLESKKIMQQVEDTAREIISGVKLKIFKTKEEKKITFKLLKTGLGLILFISALFIPQVNFLKITLFVLSYLIIGYEVLLKAVKNGFRGQLFDENFLMSIATIGAFIIHEYPEAVAVMLFYQAGEILQDKAVHYSRQTIQSLVELKPEYAHLKQADQIRQVSPDQVHCGEIILVKPGEKVPLDGSVIKGESFLDTKIISGESKPRSIKPGDYVYSGSVNLKGIIEIKVEKLYKDSTVVKILDLVQNASLKKSKTENLMTQLARIYTPIVIIISLVIGLVVPLFLSGMPFATWIYRALIFLVISCPCALVISIPLGFFGGIGAAAQKGILIKGSHYLEALNKARTIIFDKTGTLTKGVFQVSKISPCSSLTEDQLLEKAAYAEYYSNHPIAKSIQQSYGQNIDARRINNFKEISGYGIIAEVDRENILIGNEKLMQREKIALPEQDKEDATGTMIYLAVDHKLIGLMLISDLVKENAKQTIDQLKKIGLERIMLFSGDSEKITREIGKKLHIKHIFAQLLPEQKYEKLEVLEKEKNDSSKIIFVGDGVNDAPVITRSDIGIAMGSLGSDAAIESADIVIMDDDLNKIYQAFQIARKTRQVIFQNIFMALLIKISILTASSLGYATMWGAVFADVGVALLAVLNTLKIIKAKYQ